MKSLLSKIVKFLAEIFVNIFANIAAGLVDLKLSDDQGAKRHALRWFFQQDLKHVHDDWIYPALILIIILQLFVFIVISACQISTKWFRLVNNLGVLLFAITCVVAAFFLQCFSQHWILFAMICIEGFILSCSAFNWHPVKASVKWARERKDGN
jgi:hypothetical protein